MTPPGPGEGPHFLECGAPFSFYFDLVEPLWKAKDCDSSPFHRLATLARKQGARALVVEDASTSPCVRDEVAALDAALGIAQGGSEAIRLSFLTEVPEGEDIATVGDGTLIGQCTLINHRAAGTEGYGTSFVFEAFFATPSMRPGEPLLNNFINCEADFEVEVAGRRFRIRGLYYAQQNGITSVCAHACIRMVVRTLFPNDPAPSTATINRLIGDTPPEEGMLPGQIQDALRQLTNLEVALVPCCAPSLDETAETQPSASGLPPGRAVPPAEYVSILTAAADSGDVALLSFETAESIPECGDRDEGQEAQPPANHVVVTYGYTFNSDEWHPQAMPEYSAKPSVPHSPSSAWVDHFVIHDDNFGPYLALSSRALEKEDTVRADWIIVVRRHRTNLEANIAEAAASIIWKQAANEFAEIAHENNWLRFLLAYDKPLVTRPVLLTRDEYCGHLAERPAHDGSKAAGATLRRLREGLPETLWMVELTLPDLLTGNHSKLAEILLDADSDTGPTFAKERVSAIRVPSGVLVANTAGGDLKLQRFPITSHLPVYQRNRAGRIW